MCCWLVNDLYCYGFVYWGFLIFVWVVCWYCIVWYDGILLIVCFYCFDEWLLIFVEVGVFDVCVFCVFLFWLCVEKL